MGSLCDPQCSLSHNVAATSTETWPVTGPVCGNHFNTLYEMALRRKCPPSDLTFWHAWLLFCRYFSISTSPMLLRKSIPVLPEQNSQDGRSFGHMMSGAVQSFLPPFSQVQKEQAVHAPFALQDLILNIWGVDHEHREDALHRSLSVVPVSAFLPKKLNNACRQRCLILLPRA